MMDSLTTLSVPALVAQYEANENTFSADTIELRHKAIDVFKSLGFPTNKSEEWKYTNLSALLKNNFQSEIGTELTDDTFSDFIPQDENSARLIFINGKFHSKLSTVNKLPKGIIAGNIADHLSSAHVKKHFGNIAVIKSESFVALNTALFVQGAFIYVPENTVCDIPLHLIFINDSAKQATLSYPRNLIIGGKNSSVKISENHYSVQSLNSGFTNAVTELLLEENCNIDFTKNQAGNNQSFLIDYTAAVLESNSNLNIHTLTTGGKMVRNNLNIVLNDKNASAHLNGLYLTNGETHVDNHSFVDHKSADCYSNELYKGVLGGKSTGVFNGKIFVRRDAQKTNAYQSNKNILLSKEASMNAKPQLEIYADDVKCSHGATTGQLDEEALFYFRSRGIGIDQARALLTTAFAEEILERVSITSIKEKLEYLIHERLKGM